MAEGLLIQCSVTELTNHPEPPEVSGLRPASFCLRPSFPEVSGQGGEFLARANALRFSSFFKEEKNLKVRSSFKVEVVECPNCHSGLDPESKIDAESVQYDEMTSASSASAI